LTPSALPNPGFCLENSLALTTLMTATWSPSGSRSTRTSWSSTYSRRTQANNMVLTVQPSSSRNSASQFCSKAAWLWAAGGRRTSPASLRAWLKTSVRTSPTSTSVIIDTLASRPCPRWPNQCSIDSQQARILQSKTSARSQHQMITSRERGRKRSQPYMKRVSSSPISLAELLPCTSSKARKCLKRTWARSSLTIQLTILEFMTKTSTKWTKSAEVQKGLRRRGHRSPRRLNSRELSTKPTRWRVRTRPPFRISWNRSCLPLLGETTVPILLSTRKCIFKSLTIVNFLAVDRPMRRPQLFRV